jgi:hypothetical protein
MTESIRHFLTESQKETICRFLARGHSNEMAADYAGCTLEMIQKEELFDHAFAERCAHSRLRSEIVLLQRMTNATDDKKNWRAASWLLERLYPERYARRKPRTYTRAQLEEHLSGLGQILVTMLPFDAQLDVESKIKDFIDGVTRNRAPTDPVDTRTDAIPEILAADKRVRGEIDQAGPTQDATSAGELNGA